MDEQWCGSLHIGLTTLAPPELPSCPLSGLSPSLPQLRTKVTWLLCGSEVRRNGVLQRQNYCCSLDRLTVKLHPPPCSVSCEQTKITALPILAAPRGYLFHSQSIQNVMDRLKQLDLVRGHIDDLFFCLRFIASES